MTQYIQITILLYGMMFAFISIIAVSAGAFYLYCWKAGKHPAQVIDNLFNFLGVK